MYEINNNNESMNLSLIFSTTVHAIIILGVGFSAANPRESKTSTGKEVVLIHKSNDRYREDAELLSTHANQGSGNTKALQDTQGKIALGHLKQDSINSHFMPQHKVVKKSELNPDIFLAPKSKVYYYISESGHDTSYQSENESFSDYQYDLAKGSLDIAFAEYKQAQSENAIVVSSSTTYHPAARYLANWVNKVEVIGNKNYPNIALRKNITGELVVMVIITSDGSLKSSNILKSSGSNILDVSALQTIRLGAPYEVFDLELSKSANQIEIIRTFSFQGKYLKTHEVPRN